jgi:hypothetical protein
MSYYMLNAIITRSLLDGQFCKDILNGKRNERLREFDLSPAERQAILSIKADGIDQFIQEMNRWMYPAEVELVN